MTPRTGARRRRWEPRRSPRPTVALVKERRIHQRTIHWTSTDPDGRGAKATTKMNRRNGPVEKKRFNAYWTGVPCRRRCFNFDDGITGAACTLVDVQVKSASAASLEHSL